MRQTLHVGCVQMSSTESLARNLSMTGAHLRQAHAYGCQLVVLPENFAWMGKKRETFNPDAVNTVVYFLGECAKRYALWIVAGSVLYQPSPHEKPFNRSLVINPEGQTCHQYDKIHLFEANLHDESWKESDHIQAGKMPKMFEPYPEWKLGMSICYDIRFPKLYRFYRSHGCNILTVPAAFTVETGQAHWEILLRARAIENQCYVLAAAQVGEHADGRHTYGHSMIVDPWGEILACQNEGEGVIHAELSLSYLKQIREKIPQNLAGRKP